MKEITYDELLQWQNEKRAFQLIDVREPKEHKTFNIGGALIPLGEVIRNEDEFSEEIPVVFYCKRGIRSMIAIQRLAQNLSTENFYNLKGGIIHLLP